MVWKKQLEQSKIYRTKSLLWKIFFLSYVFHIIFFSTRFLRMVKPILTVIITNLWCVGKRQKKKIYLVNGPLFKVDKKIRRNYGSRYGMNVVGSSFGCVADLKRKTKPDNKRYLRSARDCGMDFPVNRKDWRKVINSDKLNDDTTTSNCFHLQLGINIILRFFRWLTIQCLLYILAFLPPSLVQRFRNTI